MISSVHGSDVGDFNLSKAKAPCIKFHITCITINSAVQRPESDSSCLAEARPVMGAAARSAKNKKKDSCEGEKKRDDKKKLH